MHGNYYGTPKSFVDETITSGKHLVMDIDVWGKVMFDEAYPQASGILILTVVGYIQAWMILRHSIGFIMRC